MISMSAARRSGSTTPAAPWSAARIRARTAARWTTDALKISVVIPTRQRAATLGSTLRTLSPPPDGLAVEVVVHNNGADPATRAVAEAFAGLPLAYAETAADLPMADNWEAAVARATGDYVIVIGDDDGLTADFWPVAATVLGQYRPALLHWEAAAYGWPDCRVPGYRNRLILPQPWDPAAVGWRPSAETIARIYAWQSPAGRAPSIYHGLVARPLIESARARFGRYFLSAVPDIAAGVVNGVLSDRYLYCSRALSIGGSSGASTGGIFAHAGSADSQALRAQFLARRAPGRLLPDESPRLMTLLLAETLIEVAERVAPDEALLQLSRPGLVAALLGNAWRDPHDYNEALRVGRQLAERFGIGINWDRVPPRPAADFAVDPGYAQGDDGIWRLTVDCAPIGIADVRGVAALIEALTGRR